MKNIISIALLCLMSSWAFSQHDLQDIVYPDRQVISSANGHMSGTNMFISYTVGQPSTKLAGGTSDNQLSQGFQQSSLAVITNSESIIPNSFELAVYPNPTSSLIHIKATELVDENTTLSLMDLNGKIILTKAFNSTEEEINISHLPNGNYHLVIENKLNKLHASYQLSKIAE